MPSSCVDTPVQATSLQGIINPTSKRKRVLMQSHGSFRPEKPKAIKIHPFSD
jgi:hypothetical protein